MYRASWQPATDVFYSDRQWLVRMELAGVAPQDIQLEVRRNTLTVRGCRRDLHLQSGFLCHSLEIRYSNFERSISLPGLIDATGIEREYCDGILRIWLRTL